jgi:hypothetical protein
MSQALEVSDIIITNKAMRLFFIKVSLVINLIRTQMYFADVVQSLAFLRTMHDLDQRLIFINFIL